MKYKDSLKKYHKKLRAEGIIRSAIFGLIIGLSASFIISIICYFNKYNGLWLAIGIGLGLAMVTSIPFYFLLFRVTIKKTTMRVDSLGLDERIITMLEYSDADTYIAQVQRRDAKNALSKVTSKQMKLVISKFSMIALAVIAALSISMTTLSTVSAINHDKQKNIIIETPGKDDEVPDLSDEDEIIKELIQQLRDIIDDANCTEELQIQLHTIVDALETDLPNYDTLLEKVVRIRETRKIIEDLLKAEIEEELIITIGQALMNIESGRTYDLGEAIEANDPDMVSNAFDMMYDRIIEIVEGAYAGTEDPKELLRHADDIEEALDNATKVSAEMKDALQSLADAFREAYQQFIEYGEFPDPDGFQEAFEDIQDAVIDAMGGNQDEQSDLEELEDDMTGTIDDALDDLGFPTQPKDGEQSDDENSDIDEGSPNPNEIGNDNNKVIDGNTDYLTVFPQTYEDALYLIEHGNLSDSLKDLIARYFNVLNPDK